MSLPGSHNKSGSCSSTEQSLLRTQTHLRHPHVEAFAGGHVGASRGGLSWGHTETGPAWMHPGARRHPADAVTE